MRITRVSGRNLTSLPHFDIAFDRGALQDVGLFAITGPTGAGKSTILDALCLALFDCTPRLTGQGGCEVGGVDEEHRLKATDPRSIMRRGEAEASAEVDFVGVDGRRYRATWTSRRAHKRANGRMQAADLALEDLDSGHRVTGTKTEVQEEVKKRLGLTFDQFRRSVLLAQGDFAAFLKANANERSELLEAMTGTEIYTELSKAAFEREKTERRAKEDLQKQRDALQILGSEERRELDERVVADGQALAEAETALKQAEHARIWYETLARRLEEEQTAGAALEAARGAEVEAEPRREELRRVESVQDLRGPVEASDHARKQVGERLDARERSRAATASARVDEAGRRADLEAGEAAVKKSERALQEAQPELDEARTLDTLLGAAQGQVKEAETALGKARKEEQESLRALNACKAQADRLDAEKAQAEAWLDGHRDIEPLADEWSRWKQELDRFALAVDQEARGSKAVAALEKEREDKKRRLDGLASEVERLKTLDAEKSRTFDEAQAANNAHPRAGIQADREEVDRRLQALAQLEGFASSAAEAARLARAAREDAERATTQAREAEAEHEASSRALAETGPALEEARRMVRQAHARLDLTPRRAELRDGDPCPLCGSKEHPLARGDDPADALVADMERRVKDLESRQNDLLAKQSRTRALREQQSEAATAALRLAETQERKQDEWQHKWDLQRPAGGPELPERADDAEAPGRIAAMRDGLRLRAEDLSAREKKGVTLADAAKQAWMEAEKVRKALDDRRTEAEAERSTLVDVEQRLTKEQATLADARGRRQDALGSVGPAFAGRTDDWKGGLEHRPDAFIRICEQRVAEWTGNRGRFDAAKQGLSELEPVRAQAETHAKLKGEERTKATAQLDDRKCECADLKGRRAKLLEGRPVEDVKRDLERAIAQAAKERARLADIHEASKQHLTKCAAEEGLAEREHEEALREAERRDLDLKARLGDRDLDAVRALLQHDSAWMKARREALDALTERRHKAETLLAERQGQREAHEVTGRPDVAEQAVVGILQELQGRTAQLKESVQDGRLRQKTDDQLRGQALRLDADIAKQTAAWSVWKSLADLIGSADGKLFRKFAQGLTLDVLVIHANRHLETLARRYRLMRVPGQDLDLQIIDLEMADEVRSINSLSGGESFLVSLALALGLASLSSHRTRVESLFIDEGFGSLDSDTLEEAIGALDALQGEGRQVGVISHVSGLAERMGVQIRVVPQAPGRSRVVVASLR